MKNKRKVSYLSYLLILQENVYQGRQGLLISRLVKCRNYKPNQSRNEFISSFQARD